MKLSRILIALLLMVFIGNAEAFSACTKPTPSGDTEKDDHDDTVNGRPCKTRFYDSERALFCNAQIQAFLTQLHTALDTNDKKSMAKLVSYPARWNLTSDYYIFLKTPDEFVRNYKKIIQPEIREALLQVTLDHIRLFPISGLGVDQGRLWLSEDKDGVIKINTFNPPGRRCIK